MDNSFLYALLDFSQTFLPIVATVATIFAAFSSGVFKRVRFGSIEIEGGDRKLAERIRRELDASQGNTPIPFEIEQLANYYSLSLGQAKVSFWFSLIFAAVGFLVIIGSALTYKEGEYIGAFLRVLSGVVIDGVSALFFVQSRHAQTSMSAFFDKLRSDRQSVEARKICDEITDEAIKGKLKTILTLHYSGLDSGPMLRVLSSSLEDKVLV